ncbi:MAG: hypothetical protein KDK51_10700, partial [Deltaproteobacteria bacterium]|nr:hypothetical protein [Deltaproteobacteria bacterium]
IKDATKIFHTKSTSITSDDIGDADRVWIISKSSGGSITLDLDDTDLDRVVVTLRGSSNTLDIQNVGNIADLCVDKMTGNDNYVHVYDSVKSIGNVDVEVTGGENAIDIETKITKAISYDVRGDQDCLSVLPDTPIGEKVEKGQGSLFYDDGRLCK